MRRQIICVGLDVALNKKAARRAAERKTMGHSTTTNIAFFNYLMSMVGPDVAEELLSMGNQEKERQYIIIGGRQGPTGKSTLCKVLRKHGYKALEMHEQKYIHLDAELQCKIADFNELVD